MTYDPDHDYTACGGPRRCQHCRDILNETPEQQAARVAEENRQRATFRVGCHADAVPPRAQALADAAAFRAEVYAMATTSARAAQVPGTSRVALEPPDPYAEALKARKENNR